VVPLQKSQKQGSRNL